MVFLITALVLIPVLLGLTPLNLAHRLASGAPLSPVKPILKCNPCLFHSLTSHPEPAQIDVTMVPFTPRPTLCLIVKTTAGGVVPSGFLPDPSPLRC